MPEYFINRQGKDPESEGITNLSTIVEAGIDVSSGKGGRNQAEQNALVLAAALTSATEAGATLKQIHQAYEIGSRIGVELKNNASKEKTDWITYSKK